MNAGLRAIGLLSLLSFLPGIRVGAQEPLALPVGTRIRVTPADPSARLWVGQLQRLRPDSIALLTGARVVDVVRGTVPRIESSRGRRSSVAATVLGFVGGAAVGGFALGCLANRDDYGVLCGGQNDTRLVVGAALGGVVGAFLGHIVSRRERWQPLDWR